MNEINIKKLDELIDYQIKKKQAFSSKPDSIIEYFIYKLNNYTLLDENSQTFENVLTKLINSGYSNIVKLFTYYLINSFNHEFTESFYSTIGSEVIKDMLTLNASDINIYSFRNYINLNPKDILEEYKKLEKIFIDSKSDLNSVILCFYYSDFPLFILDVFDKIAIDEYTTFCYFLKKFYSELSSIIFTDKLNSNTCLLLLEMLSKITSKFTCFLSNISTKEKIINSIIVNYSEKLVINLEYIVDILIVYDLKLLNYDSLSFPVQLYRIYIFYRDGNNPNKKYENIIHKYITYLFSIISNVYDQDVFSSYLKTILEFKILDYPYNPERYSTECYEVVSRFIDIANSIVFKNTYFNSHIKIISKLIDFIDYQERIDIIFLLLLECESINISYDRILTLYNLFCSLIMININYSNYFDCDNSNSFDNSSNISSNNNNYANLYNKFSLIHSLFIQNWFVILIQESNPPENKCKFRQDLFMCLIASLFYAKKQVLESSQLENYINIIQMGLDIIDVCLKLIEWKDGGEIYKMFFLILEEVCLFFEDPFFCFLYNNSSMFYKLKKQLEDTLNLIAQRFLNKVWNELPFANENSKYLSLIILSQFLSLEKDILINAIIEVIFSQLSNLHIEKKNEKMFEYLLKGCLFLCIRVHKNTREFILEKLKKFNSNLMKKFNEYTDNNILDNSNNSESITTTNNNTNYNNKNINKFHPTVANDILSFAESIYNYLNNNINKPQLIINSKIAEELNNEFSLFIKLDMNNNIKENCINYNNLSLLNLIENSLYILNIENLNSCLSSDTFSEEYNSASILDNFKKVYYTPVIEFNNEYCHIQILKKDFKYKFSEWKSVNGISDALHIYYMYKLNLQTREVELFIRSFNRTSVALRNIVFNIGLNRNLIAYSFNKNNTLSQYSDLYENYQEYTIEVLSPYNNYEFSIKFQVSKFDKNEMSLHSKFEMFTEDSSHCELDSISFYVKLTDFFINDDFALYDSKKFEVFFYSTLNYCFTVKCFIDMPPDMIIKEISKEFVVIEFKYKDTSLDKSKQIVDYLKETNYKQFSVANNNSNKIKEFNDYDENSNTKKNFKLKLSSFCIFNFWIYIQILGDYNFYSNKSILNVEIRTNDYNALNTMFKEKNLFLSELFNNKVKFY